MPPLTPQQQCPLLLSLLLRTKSRKCFYFQPFLKSTVQKAVSYQALTFSKSFLSLQKLNLLGEGQRHWWDDHQNMYTRSVHSLTSVLCLLSHLVCIFPLFKVSSKAAWQILFTINLGALWNVFQVLRTTAAAAQFVPAPAHKTGKISSKASNLTLIDITLCFLESWRSAAFCWCFRYKHHPVWTRAISFSSVHDSSPPALPDNP